MAGCEAGDGKEGSVRAIVLMRDGSFRMSEFNRGPDGKAQPMARLFVPSSQAMCVKHANAIDGCCLLEKSRHEWVRLVVQEHGWAVYVQAT